jgi:hypothetical protein
MSQPDYLICMNCESPCYIFEWKDDAPTEVFCEACGNDEPDEFLKPDDFDALQDQD